MEICIVGHGQHAATRAEAIRAQPGCTLVEPAPPLADDDFTAQESLPDNAFAAVDVVIVTGPTAHHFRVAEAALKQGAHVFLEWPPATSLPEAESMVELAKEAGTEVGVSRPLRFHPVFDALPEGARATLIVLRHEAEASAPAFWPPRCADAIDLCCALAKSHSVRRIDAEAVPNHATWPEAIAFALRFHNGTYAQISLTRCHRPTGDRLYVAGSTFQVETDLAGTEVHRRGTDAATLTTDNASPIERETSAFLDAVVDGGLPPISVLDGLHTMRLVERLMEQLR